MNILYFETVIEELRYPWLLETVQLFRVSVRYRQAVRISSSAFHCGCVYSEPLLIPLELRLVCSSISAVALRSMSRGQRPRGKHADTLGHERRHYPSQDIQRSSPASEGEDDAKHDEEWSALMRRFGTRGLLSLYVLMYGSTPGVPTSHGRMIMGIVALTPQSLLFSLECQAFRLPMKAIMYLPKSGRN